MRTVKIGAASYSVNKAGLFCRWRDTGSSPPLLGEVLIWSFFRPAGRMVLDFSGRIQRCLLVSLLREVLQWLETEAVRRKFAGCSVNKAVLGGSSSAAGEALCSSSGCHGGVAEKMQVELRGLVSGCSGVQMPHKIGDNSRWPKSWLPTLMTRRWSISSTSRRRPRRPRWVAYAVISARTFPPKVCVQHLIIGRAKHLIEQDISSIFPRTRFSLLDVMHGEDAVPVVRVDPAAVDDNTSVTVPQIQQQGPLSLSSVKDLLYLQLNTLLL